MLAVILIAICAVLLFKIIKTDDSKVNTYIRYFIIFILCVSAFMIASMKVNLPTTFIVEETNQIQCLLPC